MVWSLMLSNLAAYLNWTSIVKFLGTVDLATAQITLTKFIKGEIEY
jgi:hypothetical protein